jgi:hypothetical protein
MKDHATKNKGDLGVLKAQADLAVQGYIVLHPLTEHGAFDLPIDKDRRFKRVRSCSVQQVHQLAGKDSSK